MKIEDNVFYELETEENKYIFNSEKKAVDKIRELGEEGNPDFEEILLFEVDVKGKEWSINQIPWSKIASKLFGGK